jgi:hypothetical protein
VAVRPADDLLLPMKQLNVLVVNATINRKLARKVRDVSSVSAISHISEVS